MMTKVPLGEVAHIAMGSAPPGTSYNEIGQGIPMIAGAGDYGSIHPQPKKWTTEPSRITNVGDLIVCVRATIGDLNWADKKYCLGRGVAGLRGKEGKLDINFAAHYINAKKKDLLKLGTGSTFLAIRRSDLEEFKIPLPPLPEQRRIAAILDKTDAIRRKRQQAIRLTEEFLRSVFLDMFGDPVLNPKGWEVKRLGSLCEVGSSKRVFVNELVETGVPFYRGTEIGQLGAGQLVEPSLFITKEHYEKLKAESGIPGKGDLLLPSICPDGRIYLVKTDGPFYFKDGRVLWIKAGDSQVNSVFLRFYLKHLFFSDYSKIASGTTFAELKIFALKDLAINCPPAEQQKRFAAIAESILQQKSRQDKHQSDVDTLFNSLVQRAFRGDL